MKRPSTPHGQFVTTPGAAALIQLLGCGHQHAAIALTHDELKRVQKLYGFTPEPPNKKPEPPPAPQITDFKARWDFEAAHKKWEASIKALDQWKDPQALLQAGADRNVTRYAEADGLRLLVWIAKYVTPGEDPLKILVQLACDAGCDVDPSDVTWACDEEADTAETETDSV
jgi:hypothetical protein